MKYCKICGNKIKKGNIKEYCTESGVPIYNMVCSKDPCHGGHKWNDVEKSFFQFKSFRKCDIYNLVEKKIEYDLC